jgi:NAD+ synthase
MRSIIVEWEMERIIDFISSQTRSAGFEKVIIGLSGGIDSSVVAALATTALGKDNVIGIMLPYRKSNKNSVDDALLLATQLGIKYHIIEISEMADSYFEKNFPQADFLRKGNFLARIRMNVLYDLSAEYNALVAGTGNRSELLIGYCTQYGDNACAFEPIGHLYKTEIYKLAKALYLPKQIIEKKPSADLWEGQTDEEEIGLSYPILDDILYHLVDLKLAEKEIKSKFDPENIKTVRRMMQLSEFKRIMPPIITN